MHLLSLLSPLLDQIGYEPKSGEDELMECLREEAVKWSCVLGHPNCSTVAKEKLDWHLQDRENHK